jgi:hypothetical protein
MLMTVQPSFLASSYSVCVKVPTLLSGSPFAGPYAYSRCASVSGRIPFQSVFQLRQQPIADKGANQAKQPELLHKAQT